MVSLWKWEGWVQKTFFEAHQEYQSIYFNYKYVSCNLIGNVMSMLQWQNGDETLPAQKVFFLNFHFFKLEIESFSIKKKISHYALNFACSQSL